MQAQSGSNQLIDVEIVSSKHLVPIILEHLKSLKPQSTFISLHLLLNLREYVAGGVLLLAAAPVADGALPCHWSWRPGQHPQVLVPSHNFPLGIQNVCT